MLFTSSLTVNIFLPFLFLKFILFSYSTSNCSFPSLTPPSPLHCFLLHQIHSSISLQNGAGILGISTKHCMAGYNETRHKPSYQGWSGLPCRRQAFQEQVQESETPPLLIVRTGTKTPSYTIITYMQRTRCRPMQRECL